MFRWAFVGSVGIAETVAKEIANNNEQKIVAVFSRNFSHAKAFSEKYGGRAYRNYEDMLDDPNIDGVYVATPHAYHFYYAKRALEHKIPVLCEKSMTLGYESTKKLFEIANKNNVYLAEAMWTWFNPTACKAREWYQEGKIGKCLGFTGDFSVPSAYFGRKERLFDRNQGGGALLDLGVYPITYAYCMFGYPNSIEAKAVIKNEVDYKDEIILHYDGFDAKCTCGFTSLGFCPVKIKGEHGDIYVGPIHHEARKAKMSGNNKEVFQDKENLKGYEREFVLVSEEIKEGLKESKYVPKQQTIDCMMIMEEIKKIIGLTYPDDID